LYRKCSWKSIFIRLLILGLGIIWLVAGVSIASSPKMAPKMVQWNYIVAWILLFGAPTYVLFTVALKGVKFYFRKSKMVAEKASKQPIAQTEKAEKASARRNVNITYIDNVYIIQPKAFRVQKARSLSEQTFSTFRCKHCNSIISKDEYEAYSGLCHGCYVDSMREIRRSGLLGADRASTW